MLHTMMRAMNLSDDAPKVTTTALRPSPEHGSC